MKTMLSVYIDVETVKVLKGLNKNISRYIQDLIRKDLDIPKTDINKWSFGDKKIKELDSKVEYMNSKIKELKLEKKKSIKEQKKNFDKFSKLNNS